VFKLFLIAVFAASTTGDRALAWLFIASLLQRLVEMLNNGLVAVRCGSVCVTLVDCLSRFLISGPQ